MSKLLLPIDFTDVSKEILSYGKIWAKKEGLTPVLLYVSEAFTLNDGVEFGEIRAQMHNHPLKEQIKGVALDKMKKISAEYFPKSNCEHLVYFGDPGEVISTFANENDVSLTILGHHQKNMMENIFIGSVAEKVVRQSKKPVITIREKENKSTNPKSIAAFIDFGSKTDEILKKVRSLAKEFSSTVHLISIVEPQSPIVQELGETADYSTFSELLNLAKDSTSKKLEVIRKELEAEGISNEVVIDICTDNKSPHSLLATCQKINPDLVVMGTQGLSGLKKFLIGSTAEYFIRRYPGKLYILK